MARKPSFDFERRERDKAKLTKRVEKAKAKNDKKAGDVAPSSGSLDTPEDGPEHPDSHSVDR